MQELAIPSTEARNNFSQLVACAMWGDTRIVLCRYKFEMAAIIGVGDLMRLRELDRQSKKPIEQQPPAEPPTRYQRMLDQYLRGLEVTSDGASDPDLGRLACEIGALLEKGEDPRVALAKA